MDKKTYIIIIIGVVTILGTIFLNKILKKIRKKATRYFKTLIYVI